MDIFVAKHAGYCFGVKRAVKITEEVLANGPFPVYSFGPLIHNPQVIADLEMKNLKTIDDYKGFIEGSIIIRSHGVGQAIKEEMIQQGLIVQDCTCPVLLQIYKRIIENRNLGYQIVIIGDSNHPEVIGINGQIEDTGIILNSKEEATRLKDHHYLYVISQTTNRKEKFDEISDIINRGNFNVVIDNTICNATTLRQDACRDLSQKVDAMVVIGGFNSSNTNKLAEVAKQYCKHVFRIERIKDLSLQDMIKFNKIGITAGASTPDWTIEEVVNRMDNYSKDEFMEQVESSITKIYPKDIVKGTVIYVTDNEVMVNIGYRADGIIKLDELSTDETLKPRDLFHEGQEIDVYVIKLDDGEGNVVLSTRRVEGLKNWEALVEKYNKGEAVEAKVSREVKGGLLATAMGINAFIPGSQITMHFVKDLTPYIGQTLDCKIISIDEKKRRVVLSRRAVEEAELESKLDKAWENIHVNETIHGKVERLTDFGAFVNLGGVDGLIHVSDISWKRIKHPSDILHVGDEVDVVVLRANREKNRISLGLKQLTKKPFELFLENNAEGDIVKGTVVNLLDFGAFVRLKEGVEGLVHVSQISHDHVEKPSDELNIGDEIDVKILEINKENKRIALSIKATKPEPARPEKRSEAKKQQSQKASKEPVYEYQELDNTLGSLMENITLEDAEDIQE